MTNPAFTHREENPYWVLTPVRRRLYGIVVLAVIAGFISLSIASYYKVFTPVTMVTLETDHTGMQLLQASDVKLKGIIVGSVRSISTYVVPGPNGSQETRARLRLALNPKDVPQIPHGVTALLLPKTLFGERYVALQIPQGLAGDDARPIRKGDVIREAQSSIELGQVLTDLYPVLLALHPEDLRNTLTALATALSHRGKELGDNLAALDAYLVKLNPSVPQLAGDLAELGQVATLYSDAAPDLIGLLQNLQTPDATITARGKDLDALLTSGITTATDLQSFLNNNGDLIINVATQSTPVLKLFDFYSPEYACLAAALTAAEPHEEGAFGGIVPGLHITLEVVKDQGKYRQGDQFKYPLDDPSFHYPKCLGFPHPKVPWPGLSYEKTPYDGAVANANPAAMRSAYTSTIAGSHAESDLLGLLASPAFDDEPTSVPDVAKVLMAPLVRGTTVTVN